MGRAGCVGGLEPPPPPCCQIWDRCRPQFVSSRFYTRFGKKSIGKKSPPGTRNGQMRLPPKGFVGESGEEAGPGRDAGFDTRPEQ